MQNAWQCRISPTIGDLEDTHQNIWGTDDYTDNTRPTVFFGLYGLPDFYVLWRHKGKKAILWAGTDIKHFLNGYWLDELGKIRLNPKALAKWIDINCKNYVENEIEKEALASVGITAFVAPSFLGDKNKFEASFKPGNKLYTSVSGDDFKTYGWDKIPALAQLYPQIEFHLYGNARPLLFGTDNIIVHGRVSKEQMNREIKEMQGALRLTEFDGFSEILAKSFLMGQYPVSLIKVPHALPVEDIAQILNKTEPNMKARDHYFEYLNKYQWNTRS